MTFCTLPPPSRHALPPSGLRARSSIALSSIFVVSIVGVSTLAMSVPALARQGAQQDAPQTPGGGAGFKPNEFPGPRGTKISFPTGLYDEKAVAVEQIKAARARAIKENKRVLVMWGENKCGFCVFLNDMLTHDEFIAPTIKGEYVWIKIDIGKFDRNIELAKFYDTPITEQGFGAPALTIIDPLTDKAVAVKGGNSLTAKPMTTERVFDELVVRELLLTNKPPAKVAQSLVNEACVSAKKNNKRVLAVFVTPSSEASEQVVAWLDQPQVITALTKGADIVRIDTERMIGGRTVLNRMSEGKVVAAPFFAVMNVEGDLAAPGASFSGLPEGTEAIERFTQMLKANISGLDEAGLASLAKTLSAPKAGEAKPVEMKK